MKYARDLNLCMDKLKKLHGMPPYNTPSNICWSDGHFARSIKEDFDEDIVEAAKVRLGLMKPKPAPTNEPEEDSTLLDTLIDAAPDYPKMPERKGFRAIGHIVRNQSGQILIRSNEGDHFDMSKYIGKTLFIKE